MFIILEGPDGAGKSTLAEQIYHKLKISSDYLGHERKILHCGPPPERTRRGVLEQYVLSIEDYDAASTDVVADRWHFGEATYAPILRPETNTDGYGLLGKAGWRWTELFLLSRGAVTLNVLAPLDMLKSRLLARGDDLISVDQLEQIVALYDAAFKQSPTTVFSVDASAPIKGALGMIIDDCARVDEAAECLWPYPSYIGHWRPTALLVGDTRNVTQRYGSETRLPFMPVNGNSGDFLLSNLDDTLWRDFGLVNGNEPMLDLHGLWVALGRPRVVALGANAYGPIARAGIDPDAVIRVPHPQYVRRFHRSRAAEYGERITLAAQGDRKAAEWLT